MTSDLFSSAAHFPAGKFRYLDADVQEHPVSRQRPNIHHLNGKGIREAISAGRCDSEAESRSLAKLLLAAVLIFRYSYLVTVTTGTCVAVPYAGLRRRPNLVLYLVQYLYVKRQIPHIHATSEIQADVLD